MGAAGNQVRIMDVTISSPNLDHIIELRLRGNAGFRFTGPVTAAPTHQVNDGHTVKRPHH